MHEATLSLLGVETLLGRELRDQLAEQSVPAEVELVSGDEEAASILTEYEGEPAVIGGFDPVRLLSADVVLLAGAPALSRRAYEIIKTGAPRPKILDLTGGLEEEAESRLAAPMTGSAGLGDIGVIAHPAAIAIALVLQSIGKTIEIRRSVGHIFEPASEQGQAGIDELQRQTSSLLTFKALPKEVYDAQLSFNMLPRFGEESPYKLEEIEQRAERHLASLLGSAGLRLPSLRMVQAPVFHGSSISLWIEFDRAADPSEVARALKGPFIEVRASELEPPTNVGVAGQPGITVGLIELDRNNGNAVWLWIAADNYRLTVDNAIMMLRGWIG